MRDAVSTQDINYRFLTKWFFASGALRFRRKLLLLVVLTILAAFSEGVSLWLIVPVFRAVIPAAGTAGDMGAFVNYIADTMPVFMTSFFGDDAVLIAMLALMLLLVIAKTILVLSTNWQTARCTWGLMSDWAKKLLDAYLHKDYLSFLKYKYGTMLGNITIEARIAAIGVRDAIQFISQLVLTAVYVAVLFVTDWKITLFQIAAIILLGISTWGFTHRLTSRISRDILTAKQRVESDASESLAGYRQLKASALENNAVEKFGEPVDEMATLMTQQKWYNSMPKPVSELLVLLLVISTIYYLYAFTDTIIATQIPTLTLLVIIANRLFMSLAKLSTAYMAFTASLPSMEQIARQLHNGAGVTETPAGSADFDLRHGVEFSDVSFRYPDQSENVLQDLNLNISGGQLTAIVGSSGGGKSTIIDLLLGFIEQDSGSLLIGGHDGGKLDIKKVRKKIGYVSQDVFLFDASIRENLLIHNPDASMERIAEVCRQANISRLIARLPDDFDTLIGPRGARLSGGERQRLAIACALLRDPDLLIFDEATNAMDPDTESAVHAAVRGLRNKTVLFVTHRVSPALNPDRVFEIRHGKACEIATIAESDCDEQDE